MLPEVHPGKYYMVVQYDSSKNPLLSFKSDPGLWSSKVHGFFHNSTPGNKEGSDPGLVGKNKPCAWESDSNLNHPGSASG